MNTNNDNCQTFYTYPLLASGILLEGEILQDVDDYVCSTVRPSSSPGPNTFFLP